MLHGKVYTCFLLYHCTLILLLSSATSHYFKWFSLVEMRWGIVFLWWGMVLLYPKIRVIPVYVEHWLLLCRECDRWGTRVFGQWSRHWQLANILSDPVQIQCTLTSWEKAWCEHDTTGWRAVQSQQIMWDCPANYCIADLGIFVTYRAGTFYYNY